MDYEPDQQQLHSAAWIAQVWLAFGGSVIAGAAGIFFLPVGPWERGFMALSFVMLATSSIALSKTVRDIHESNRLVKKVDEAKVTKLLADHQVQF